MSRWHWMVGAALVTLGLTCRTLAQVPPAVQPDLASLADGKVAQVYNRAATVAREDGQAVVRFDARGGDGGAILRSVELGDGVIDIDLRGRDVAQQSFLGVSFRVVDPTTFDAVYFRPFNFRAATPEQRSHAVQYVSHPSFTWQRLRAERPGQCEAALENSPDPNGWFHARIVIADGKVEVFVDGATRPVLSVGLLSPHRSGGVGLFVGNASDGAFRNLKITPTGPVGPRPPSTQDIFQASATGNLDRLRILVEADPAIVSSRNRNGLTPLHAAAMYQQIEVAEYLLSKGASHSAVARHSGTPVDLAYEVESQPMIRLLESKGGRPTPFTFEVTRLTPSIHRLAFPWGMMGNVLVFSSPEGAVLVDTGFSARAIEDLRKTVARFTAAGIRYVINTHDHGDHVAGNAIAPSPSAVITAASLQAGTMAGLVRGEKPMTGRTGRTLPAPYTMRFGSTEMELIPRPGLHSVNDLIVYFPKEGVVDLGDLLLSESMPALRDIGGYMSFLDDVLDVFPPTATFVSGHGRDLTADGLRQYRDTLNTMIGIVRTQVAAGRTAEQMIEADVFKAYRDRFGLLDFLLPNTLIPAVVTALQQGALK